MYKMKTFLLPSLSALLIAGCASVNGLRDKPADLSLTTTKTPSAYGACVAQGWGGFFHVDINQGPTTDGGYSVSMPDQNTGNNGVMDAKPISSGAAVSVRYRVSWMGGYGKFTKVIHDCA